MKIIKPSFEIIYMDEADSIQKRIETAGRLCYKSESNITENSYTPFIQKIIQSGHHSVIEHASVSVKFICDRGVSHEIVRHRMASYSQESTRYANYSNDRFGNEITVIKPCFWEEGTDQYSEWSNAMLTAEKSYMALIMSGATAQQARSVLPNSLKTEIIVTCNLREWRHILDLRCAKAAHPQIREIMLPLLIEIHRRLPAVFSDIFEKYRNDFIQ